MSNERSRRWQITENNADYTKERGAELVASIGETEYVASGCEMGESGTKHIHIFVVFKNAINEKSIKKVLPRCHYEKCRGSNAQNREYVIKDGDYFESGALPLATFSERKDTSANEVIKLLQKGASLLDLMSDYPELTGYCIDHFRTLKEIEEFIQYRELRRIKGKK